MSSKRSSSLRPDESLSLIKTLGTTKCFELLNVILFKPDKMYQSEIVKKSGLSPNTAIPLLKKLTVSGLLKEEVMAGTIFYQVIEDNPLIKQLKILINMTGLYELTGDFSGEAEIFLFGSAARGEDTENSDIDLLVLANGSMDKLNELKKKIKKRLTKKLNREVNPIVYARSDYSGLFYTQKTLFESIEKDKIKVQ